MRSSNSRISLAMPSSYIFSVSFDVVKLYFRVPKLLEFASLAFVPLNNEEDELVGYDESNVFIDVESYRKIQFKIIK